MTHRGLGTSFLNCYEQVIAPFLIVLRVINRSALTSEVTSRWTIDTVRFGGGERSTGGNGTLSDGCPVSSVDAMAEVDLRELGVGVENAIDEVPL